jgi:hypothetical protein
MGKLAKSCETGPGGRALGPAVLAHADDLDVVRRGPESDLSRCRFDPAARAAPFQLDHAMAAATDDVVVVGFAAEAVARFSRDVRHCVQDSLLRERPQRAVHGCEPDRFARRAQPLEQLLSRRVMRFSGELFEDTQALPCRANTGAEKPLA